MDSNARAEPIRRVHVVLNPRAGRGLAARIWDQARPIFARVGIEAVERPTSAPGDGRQLARSCPLADGDGLVVIGGDGSFHDVVDGLLSRDDGRRVPLGLLAGGTGNAFARDAELMDPVAAATRMSNGVRRSLDVLRLETPSGRVHAFNIVGWGLAGDVAGVAERLRPLGARRYDIASAWLALRRRVRPAQLELDGERLDGEFSMVFVANNETTGAGMVLLPGARFDDGLVDVLVVPRLGRFELLRLLAGVASGRHLEHPAVLRRRVRRLRIGAVGSLNVDGEPLSGAAPVSMQVLPSAIQLLG